MTLNLVKNKMIEHNNSIEAIRARLFPKKTEKQIFSEFQDSIEKELETIPATKIEESKLTFKQILEQRKLAAQKENELAPEAAQEADLGESSLADAKIYQGEENEEVIQKTLPSKGDAAKGTQESFALNIVLNEKQAAAKEMALSGKSFVLIGAAGTGKTTTQRSVAEVLVKDSRLEESTFKTYSEAGDRRYVKAPSIAFCAYTRRAAANLAKAILKSPELEKALPNNIMTIHSLLEYEPETYWDAEEMKEKFRFAPKRTASNPLNITHLVIEEASMLGLDLWEKLYDALPEGIQIIFIGDINQLPPVFGPSILNYALVQLPIVELSEVYRNQGIVLENAHNILQGKSLKESPNFQIVRGKQETQVGQHKMAVSLASMFEQLSEKIGDDGLPEYDPETCMILSPFNKKGGQKDGDDGWHLGTNSVNKWMAQFIGQKRGAIVHEIIAGFNKLYLAVGDKVMFNKRDAVITKIERNFQYHGREPQLPGADLTRFGHRIIGHGSDADLDDLALDYTNFSLEELEKEKAERKMQASHTVTIDYGEGRTETISAAGDFADAVFSLGYCLTVHKAQGSEWRKVFILLHKDHSIMAFRELFYTAVTRARTKVVIISKDFMIKKAIENQRIKGNTIEDKIAYFNSGINDLEGVFCVK